MGTETTEVLFTSVRKIARLRSREPGETGTGEHRAGSSWLDGGLSSRVGGSSSALCAVSGFSVAVCSGWEARSLHVIWGYFCAFTLPSFLQGISSSTCRPCSYCSAQKTTSDW